MASPASPPQLVRPTRSTSISFEQALSNKLHSSLVIPSIVSKKQPTKSGSSTSSTLTLSSKSTLPVVAESQSITPYCDTKDNSLSLPIPIQIEPNIHLGIIEKNTILDKYQSTYGSDYPDSIVTKKKGKISDDNLCLNRSRMRPSLDKWYRVEELYLYNVITTIIKECLPSFTNQDLFNLRLVNKDFANIIPKVCRWLRLDFTSLREPRYFYEDQECIDLHRVEMASAAMIHFGLDPGKFVRWLSGEYTGQYRDVHRTLSAIHEHVGAQDYQHIKRILLDGCPAQFTFLESSSNKLEFISRGNSKTFKSSQALVRKTMNKEDRYSHLVPMDPILCKLSPYLRHTTQSIVIKEGKNDRIVWDGSTVLKPSDIVMNQITPIAQESPITFGHVKLQVFIDLYNMRISYPTSVILIALADIKACFRFARIHADLTGAFGFLADDFYNLATAMVFGSTASASSWESFRRAIEALTVVFANRSDLVMKHERFINMIKWDDPYPLANITPARPCNINKGIMNESGIPIDLPARIYVDDAIMLSSNANHMKMVLAAMIESIFVVMGEPEEELRQCPLAMDKWRDLVIGPRQTVLGLIIDTNRMTVSIPLKYRTEVLALLESTWHHYRRRFKVSEAQKLTGKLARLAEGANWVFHLLSHLYSSIAYALSENKKLLSETSQEFRDMISIMRTNKSTIICKDLVRHTSFAMKRAAKMTHHASYEYNISTTMRAEIEFFRDNLKPDSGIEWETPIAHLIPRTPFAITIGDSSLEGAGGFSIGLGFWWHMQFPPEIVQRTLLFRDSPLVSINVLEYVTVIINYIAALHVLRTTKVTDDPHPVLLNITDNSSALSWTLHTCKRSKVGRLLGRFFCSFLINSPLGINSQWISTDDNKIADDISRLKKQHSTDTNSAPRFDYTSLKQIYPELMHCSFFQIEPSLISMIWDIVLTENWPSHDKIQRSKRKPLGRLITSSGQIS